MASEHLYDIVKVDRVEGRAKPFYSKVGKVIRTEKGYVKAHIPLIGWLDLFEPRPDDARDTHPQHTETKPPAPAQSDFQDDDIPF